MSISFIEAQRRLGEETGSYRLLTTSGAGTDTTIVDTGLQDLFLTDTSVTTGWVRVRNGITAGEIRRLDGTFTQSTGTLTVTRDFSGIPGISVDYELWTINPADIINAIKRAVAKLYPIVYRRLVDTTTIVNNILDNPTLEDSETVLSFDGGGTADDLVTVTDDSTIDDIWTTAGGAEWKATVYSDGENDLGFVMNKVNWSIGYRDEENGYVRVEFTIIRATTNGVWVTADRCWKLSEPHIGSLRYNSDDVANDAEFFLDGVRQTLLPTSHSSGAITTDNGSDLTIGNIAAATRTLDGVLYWIRLWNDWRSDREISENLNARLTGDELGLIGYWIFDFGSGSTVYDLSVSQNNGAITSATWTVDIPFWTQVNAPTITLDRERTFGGQPTVKMVSGGSAGQFTQISDVNIDQRSGKSVKAEAWVWTDADTQARLRLDWDGGTTFENGDYHAGDSQFELITVQGQVPSNATEVKVILETIASQTAWWAYVWFHEGPKKEYPLPSDFETLARVSQQSQSNIPDGLYIPFADSQTPTTGRLLKLEGRARIPVPGESEDLLEINDKQLEYLTALSAVELYQTLQARVEGTPKTDFIADRNDWAITADILSRDRGVRTGGSGAELNSAWHVERAGMEPTLVFENA